MTKVLRGPINYYGGKVKMIPKIIPLLPKHKIYNEPFFGGGAIFFAKEPSKIEFINDINKQVVNFYKVAKRQFEELKQEIDCTLYSEEQFLEARNIYLSSNPDQQTNVIRAWALFVLSHQTFLNVLDNTWKISKYRNEARTFQNKKDNFDIKYVKRLENTQIFCRDAIKVIKQTDTADTLHFVDPPYCNTNMGHYGGYTLDDYKELLSVLGNIKGMFLLTSFPSETLSDYTSKNGWYKKEFIMQKSASGKAGDKKTEVVTANFQL